MVEALAGLAITVVGQVLKKKKKEDLKLPINGFIPPKYMPVVVLVAAGLLAASGFWSEGLDTLQLLQSSGETAGWSVLVYNILEQIKKGMEKK